MKGPEVSIRVTDLTLRFPVYGVDAKSLKKHLARITVGGKLGRTGMGATEVTALSNINLELRSGDRLGLIGHNGSGKTTLLRALAGAYEPDEGTIDVHGQIAAMLDLNLGIDPSATGLDNIRLRGRIAGLSAKEIERILELMERAGILVLASHDLELIRLYCNKVMRIESGVASPIMDVKKLDELLAAA